jgi:hypothetical protein
MGNIGAGGKEAVVGHLDRFSSRAPLTARVSQPAQLLLLFRIDADDRLAGRLMVLDLLIEVAELGIPIRVLLPSRGSWRWPAG